MKVLKRGFGFYAQVQDDAACVDALHYHWPLYAIFAAGLRTGQQTNDPAWLLGKRKVSHTAGGVRQDDRCLSVYMA
jgi:hypothetical protein